MGRREVVDGFQVLIFKPFRSYYKQDYGKVRRHRSLVSMNSFLQGGSQ